MTDYNGETILKCLDDHAATKPDDIQFVDRKNGEDISFTFQEAHHTVNAIAKSLARLYQGPGHKISILSKNRAHWVMADLGIMRSGNVVAPVFTSMPPKTFSYALEFAEIELIFVGEAGNWPQVKDLIPAHVKTVTFPGVELADTDYTFDAFLELGRDTPLPAHPDPEKTATIIFTSGTTGLPKGVMHSLKTLFFGIRNVMRLAGPQARFFSYLPLAHLGDRAVISLHAVQSGSRLAFTDSQETFLADLQAAAPTMFLGIPRIFDKLTQGILAKFGGDEKLLRTMLEGPEGNGLIQMIKAGLGFQNIDFIMASTAPTSQATKEWWARIDLPILDGYGMTEGLPITSVKRDDPLDSGVGKPEDDAEIKISGRGEILSTGPGQALGYFKNEAATAETFKGGWLHTGDRGFIDDRGFLHITGRLQDTFKTAKGKYVAPVPLELTFSRCSLVEQQCLYGYGLVQPIMLCCLAEAAPKDKMLVEQELKTITQTLNQELEPHERIGGIIICGAPWSIENGILTHTMKVKRDEVANAYRPLIEAMGQELTLNSRAFLIHWSR